MGMDIYGRSPKSEAGKYIRFSAWSWRPVHQLASLVLRKELRGWAFNDGDGFATQLECDDLAAKLADYLTKNPSEMITMESDLRVDESGKFIDKVSEQLARGILAPEGKTPYECSHEHVWRFINFLRECGGFMIN